MKPYQELVVQLRSRILLERMDEAKFVTALAEIVAATPDRMGVGDHLLLSNEIRTLKNEWRRSRKRPLD